MRKRNPWDEFKTVGTARPPSRNTPGNLMLILVFWTFLGFLVGAGVVLWAMLDLAVYWAHDTPPGNTGYWYYRSLVLAGGILGAVMAIHFAWRSYPRAEK